MTKRSAIWIQWFGAAAFGVAVLVGAPDGVWAQGKPDAAVLDEAERLNEDVLRLHGEGGYDEALPLATRALALREKALAPDHPAVAQSLNNLALLYMAKGDDARAEPLLRRELDILEKTLGKRKTATAFMACVAHLQWLAPKRS